MNCVASRYAGPNVCPAILSVASPASLIVKRYGPVSVGVSMPVHLADHDDPTPLGGLVRSTVGSTSVTAGVPVEV